MYDVVVSGGTVVDPAQGLHEKLDVAIEGGKIAKLAPAGKSLANATGNGSWGDVSGPAGPLPDNLLCVAGLVEGCR